MPAYARDPQTGAITPIPMEEWRGTVSLGKVEIGPYVISTVFLGLDHSGGLFETMVFGPDGGDIEMFRYELEDDAMENHVVLVHKYGRLWRHKGKSVIDLRKI